MVIPNTMAGNLIEGSYIARADDNIGLLGNDPLDKQVNLIGEVLSITIETNHDLWVKLAPGAKAGVHISISRYQIPRITRSFYRKTVEQSL
jgi:hypothetical protein